MANEDIKSSTVKIPKDYIPADGGHAARFKIRYLQTMMMFLCSGVLYVVRSSMGVAILAMTTPRNNTEIEVYQWSENVRGMVLSSFFWGYTLLQIPAGVLAKRFGGHPLLFGSLLLNGLLSLAVPTLAKYGGWMAICAVRAAMGLSQACFMPGCHTLLGKWSPPEERTRMSSVAYAGIPIGTILAMPLCGILSNTALGWKLIFYCMGVLTIVTGLLWGVFAASSPAEHRFMSYHERVYIEKSLQSGDESPSMSIPWRQILTSRPLFATACAHIGYNWCLMIFLVETPTYVKTVLGIDLANSSTLAALPFMAQWLLTIVFGFACEYMYNNNICSLTTSRKIFNSIGAVGVAGGLLMLSFLDSRQAALALVVLTATGGIIAASTGGYQMNHIDLSPNFGGVMYGLTNCAANMFGTGVPILTSFVLGDQSSDISRWRIVFFTSASLILLSNVIFVTLGSAECQKWNSLPPSYDAYNFDVLEKDEPKKETLYKFKTEMITSENDQDLQQKHELKEGVIHVD
ncbi:Putative inorganic phosphate cotransporter [Eumeta japonica]|uniref:Putative inorganic phosphate cotransporter n=1 Tax=Eumeta variegata TaxID=151549 RepID=A0A4C1YMQ5_EUMVA|nr:Putative inorganic phosphate cotransporter [Eumeta japonica]